MGRPRGPTVYRFVRAWYWCSKCKSWHRFSSNIGQNHKEFKTDLIATPKEAQRK